MEFTNNYYHLNLSKCILWLFIGMCHHPTNYQQT